jgi:hypothetical protein
VLSSHARSELTGADWFIDSLEQVSAQLREDGWLSVRLEL